jgi:hypothetical protein
MYGGGKKTQWEEDGVMAETFEKAPHGYQKGRRRGLSLSDTNAKALALGGAAAFDTIDRDAVSSLSDPARQYLYRNAFPSYQYFNSYNTVFNNGLNKNFIKMTLQPPHHAPPRYLYGNYLFKNPDFYPGEPLAYQWAEAEYNYKQVGPKGGTDRATQDAWRIIFTKGRADFATTDDQWVNEPHELPSVDENGYQLSYHYKISQDYQVSLNKTKLFNMPIREEYMYIGIKTLNLLPLPANNAVGESVWGALNGYTVGSDLVTYDSVLHIYGNKYHMQYALFGENSLPLGDDDPVSFVDPLFDANFDLLNKGYITNVTFKDPLHSPYDKISIGDRNFSTSMDWHQVWERLSDTGMTPLFKLDQLYLNLDFVVNQPYSPAMADAAGLTDNYLMVASIESEFEFSSKEFVQMLKDNNVHENVLPNFYSFLSLLNSRPNDIAPKDMVFFNDWGDVTLGGHNDQLTLGGLIDPSQIPLIGKDYMDYQQYSQLPPGHSNWVYDNNKPINQPYTDITHFDYWSAWQEKYSEMANMGSEDLWFAILGKNKNIVFPYESTNFLNDFNDKITLFPCHTKIEWPRGSKPIIPSLLRQAKADKYVMRAIIAAGIFDAQNTEVIQYGAGAKDVSDNQFARFKAHIEHPAGEKTSGDYVMAPQGVSPSYFETPKPANLFEKYNDVTLPPYPVDLKIPDDIKDSYGQLPITKMWDLTDLINGFKVGENTPWHPTISFEDLDKNYTNYIGLDSESGWPFGQDLSPGDPSTSFTKSIYAAVLEKKLQNFALKNMKSYAQMMNGDKCYSEIIIFNIEKVFLPGPDQQPEPIQSIWMWNTGDLERITYLDTQVVPGRKYTYKIFAYYLVLGGEYRYFDRNEKFPELMGDKYVKELMIKNRPTFRIVKVPWFGFEEISQMTTIVQDAPPVPPDPSFIPYKNVSDKINITIKTNSGEFSTNKLVKLLPGDEDVWQDILKAQNELSDGVVTFKSDTLPASYEVFRIGPDPTTGLTKPPTTYNSFATEEPYKIIEVDGSSQSFDDVIEANTTYYYTFRSRDHGNPGFISNPTSVFKLEMIQEAGKNVVFPVITVYEMKPTSATRSPSKTMKRFLHINPAYENTLINEEDSGYLDEESAKTSQPGYDGESGPQTPKVGANENNYELFYNVPSDGDKFDDNGKSRANRFKIRLTSKKSGRKIDINVGFLHKHNE